jgi:hypothetical protein
MKQRKSLFFVFLFPNPFPETILPQKLLSNKPARHGNSQKNKSGSYDLLPWALWERWDRLLNLSEFSLVVNRSKRSWSMQI